MPTPPKRPLSASISGPRKSAMVARFRPGGPPVSGTLSRTSGRRRPPAFEEQIDPRSRAHSATRHRAREHHGSGPSLRPDLSLVEPTSPDQGHTRSRDRSTEAPQGGTDRSDPRSGLLRREVVRPRQVLSGSSRSAGTYSSDLPAPVSELPRRGVAARHHPNQRIVYANAWGQENRRHVLSPHPAVAQQVDA